MGDIVKFEKRAMTADEDLALLAQLQARAEAIVADAMARVIAATEADGIDDFARTALLRALVDWGCNNDGAEFVIGNLEEAAWIASQDVV